MVSEYCQTFSWIRSRKIQWWLGENNKSSDRDGDFCLFDIYLQARVLEFACFGKYLAEKEK